MSNRHRLLTVDNLVVVNSVGKSSAAESYLEGSAKAWKAASQHKLIIPTDCAHRLWIGSQDVFRDFPEDGKTNLNFIEGVEAYKFLLTMLSGLDSPEICETHIRRQFKDSWKNMQQPEEGEDARVQEERKHHVNLYQTLYGYVVKDSGYVSENILGQYKKPQYASTARSVSGQVGGDKILIIGDINEFGRLDDRTQSMIRTSENKQKGFDEFLSLSHPDEATLEQMKSSVGNLMKQKKIHSKIRFVNFDSLSQSFEESDRVYVETPMALDMQSDAMIFEAWKNRARRDNTITHLRGSFDQSQAMEHTWREQSLDNFFSPKDIAREVANRDDKNEYILKQAGHAIDLFTRARKSGEAPRKRQILLRSAELANTEPYESFRQEA